MTRKTQRILLPVLAVGFLLRLGWILYFPNTLYADAQWYYEQAINLAQNQGYRYQGAPTAIWPVGYPFFLSLVFRLVTPSLLVAKFVNVLLLTLDLWLIFYLADLITAEKPLALLVTGSMALAPTHILAGSLVATEPLFACLIHLQLILLLLAIRLQRAVLWIFNGIWTGLLMYIRPEAGVFLLIVLFGYGLSNFRRAHRSATSVDSLIPTATGAPAVTPAGEMKTERGGRVLAQRIALPALIVLGSILTVAPWTVRNWTQLGLFVPISTTGCMNLWMGNAPGADGGYYWPRDPASNPTLLREGDTEQSWYRRSCQAAAEAIRQNPFRALRLWPAKVIKLWEHDHDLVYWNFASMTQPLPAQQIDFVYWVADVYYGILGGLALIAIGYWLLRRARWSVLSGQPVQRLSIGYWICAATLIGFTLVYLPFFGSPRFHFALFPLVVIFAAQTLMAIQRFILSFTGASRRLLHSL